MGVYKRNESWYSEFWVDGVRYRKSWGEISKVIAKEKDGQFRREVKEGRQQQKAKRVTFKVFSEKYLESCRLNLKPKSAERREDSVKALTPHFGFCLLSRVNPFMVEQFKKARRDQGLKPATINRDIDCLNNALNKAVQWNYLNFNPLAGRGVKRFKEDNEVTWALTNEEEKNLLEACGNSPQRGGKEKRYLRDLVLFALHSAMRQQEIFNLTKSRIHLQEHFLEVVDTKTGVNRKVPLNDTLKAILEARLKDDRSEYVFCNSKGKRLTVLTNAFWFAVKCAGLTRIDAKTGKTTRFRFHDLRHSFLTRLGEAGVDQKTIMEISGIRTAKVAVRYQHPATQHKLQAVRLLDKKIPPKSPTGEIIEFRKVANSNG